LELILLYKTIACLGPDALRFLQGQLSCDMREVGPNALSLGCYCSLKGRVIAAPYLYAVPEGFHLIVPADLTPVLLKSLNKFIVFSKATLSDLSEAFPVHPLLGESPHSLCPGAGFALGENAQPTDEKAWEAHLIEHKIPLIALAQSERFLPHDLGLVELGAVSFNKGCYVGQEIIARMHYKAKLKKHPTVWVGQGEYPLEGEIVNQVDYAGKRYVLAVSSLNS
jgi:folate-binding protein YgfZ